MTSPKKPLIHSLSRLVDVREREIDRMQAELAAKEAVRVRYQGNLQRMEGLCAGSGPSGALPAALSINCANFKQQVMQMADAQRQVQRAEACVERKREDDLASQVWIRGRAV